MHNQVQIRETENARIARTPFFILLTLNLGSQLYIYGILAHQIRTRCVFLGTV